MSGRPVLSTREWALIYTLIGLTALGMLYRYVLFLVLAIYYSLVLFSYRIDRDAWRTAGLNARLIPVLELSLYTAGYGSLALVLLFGGLTMLGGELAGTIVMRLVKYMLMIHLGRLVLFFTIAYYLAALFLLWLAARKSRGYAACRAISGVITGASLTLVLIMAVLILAVDSFYTVTAAAGVSGEQVVIELTDQVEGRIPGGLALFLNVLLLLPFALLVMYARPCRPVQEESPSMG